MRSAVLSIEELRVKFRTPYGVVRAVDGVDLSVGREKFFLIGESGSGKSVLALAVLRLLPKNAEVSGRIVFEGRNLLELSEEEMRKIRGKKIAYVPQSRSSLNPVLTVGYQCAEPLVLHENLDRRSALIRVARLFEVLKIGGRLRDYPHQFSGGMRQRVLVAMGVSTKPDLIIADEPTKGLDYTKREQVVELFERMKDAMLVITHDVGFAERVADRVAVVYCGRVVEVADATEFFNEPLHPYTKGLLESLPSRGLKPIRGFQPSMVNPPPGCRFAERCEFAGLKCREEPPLFSVDGRLVRCWRYA